MKETVATVHVSQQEKATKVEQEATHITVMGTKVKKEVETSQTALKYLIGDCFEISDEEEEAHEEVNRYVTGLEDRKLKNLDSRREMHQDILESQHLQEYIGKTHSIYLLHQKGFLAHWQNA